MEVTEERRSKIDDRTIGIIQSEQNKDKGVENKMNRTLGTYGIKFKCLIFIFSEVCEKGERNSFIKHL